MKKLLIANRGEIARRIIRTAHAMGIETVAVYSDADATAPHVREATQAVHIGPAPATESYLDPAKLLDAARRTGADAVHPGYGFLSENAGFAESVIAAGLTWVGPPVAAMQVMGLKDSAKAAMKKAGVPITPGYQGNDQGLVRLERAAAQIGFPLLIKAVAGGGGKGMRSVPDPQSFAENLLSCQREGAKAFGNDGVMLEKLIARPRHVEVQVFADQAGNVVHLFERDCSLQRRHQKVIEEAPAPGLSERLRHTLGIAAVTAAHAIKYEGAGTVEFILDLDTVDAEGDPAFYFMEMNTRLQVEHPVTEAITGFDLVEWQLRIARGEMLPAHQDAITAIGHSVEARLYAEDADNGFLPSTGKLSRLRFPTLPGTRIDSGVETGSAITVNYDPMIAKVIAYGPDRATAIDRLVAALDGCVVEGVKSNRAFLARLADHPAFRAGEVDTGFIGRHADDLVPSVEVSEQSVALAALALTTPRTATAPTTMFERFATFRVNLAAERSLELYAGETKHSLMLSNANGMTRVGGLAAPVTARARWVDDLTLEADLDGNLVRAVVLIAGASIEVRLAGKVALLSTRPARLDPRGLASDARVTAPMPGRVLALDVAVGQAVAIGDRLLVLEAMKMEHRLSARLAGTVSAVHVSEGDQVGDGTLLVEIEA
ncbi:acetyl/propionyl/methylcrotonyl-CoA carboxylase subunit alpha [Glacieibacterium sp.]|uniref:acetyl/propionyl/methylcrotonyl-CoA carboxylase subunit alpha n=1 Tax=Glacieibacterium sp. TaxID=2860237 RepID=UPI003B004F2A